MSCDRNILRGAAAGMVGGLVASWVMNQVMSVAGPTIEKQAAKVGDGAAAEPIVPPREGAEQESATMKAADAIVAEATGGRHLTYEGRKRGGPIVHYAFGSLIGAVYGGLAECVPQIGAGAGTSFGTALFAGADLCAVPAFRLGQNPAEQPPAKLASPFVAHLVYGLTTDIVRRALR